MSGLKEIRTRINSITSTQKITSAMKMVSAAKFHKAQESIIRYRSYSRKILQMLAQVLPSVPEIESSKWFASPAKVDKVALVVITSNSSMCGGFNQNLIKMIVEKGPSLFPEIWCTNNVGFYCLGKKGADYFSKKGYNVSLNDHQTVNKPVFNDTSKFIDSLLELFINGQYDAVYIAFNHFKNPALQEPVIRQFLPFIIPDDIKVEEPNTDLVFEPTVKQLMELLIPATLRTLFHQIILENSIGEHGARMTAMHQATENAIELNKNLKLQYNKARQAAITKEILEIVSGAEALKSR